MSTGITVAVVLGFVAGWCACCIAVIYGMRKRMRT